MSQSSNQSQGVDAGIGRKSALATARLTAQAIRLNNLKISFVSQDMPVISVVIVSRNATDLLCMTLSNLALHRTTEKALFEVIVVDNASDPETIDILKHVENAQIIYNEKNIGFGPGCNMGARIAKGKYILFLNPDADLLPGALDAMIEGFGYYDNTGIVGARLVFPGGILQEAGAYFAEDAQLTHPYLRGVPNASAPEAVFMREVGYVSGAVLMIERGLFESLDGFDKAFAPAYFEDADLCLRCAQIGRRIVYQPRAIAFHYENATSPSRADVETLLNKHRKIFLERHKNWLFESGTHPSGFMIREPDRHRFRVLYVDDHTPHIDSGAGLPRANSIVMNMVALGYFVTILPVYSSDDDLAARYRDIDPRVEILHANTSIELRRIVHERAGYYDLIWVSRPHNIDMVVRTFLESGIALRGWVKSRIIFDTEALFSTREAVLALNKGGVIDGHMLTAAVSKETEFANIADLVVCVSRSEQSLLQLLGGVANTRILGHAMVSDPGSKPFEERDGILFVGPLTEDGTPNVDSIDWFLKKAWPSVLQRLRDRAELILVGNISMEIRERFERPGVRVLGRVDKLNEIFNSVRVSIAPTRFAAGIPQKVHNCVAHGVPMVISPLLRAQLNWDEGVGCLSAAWQDPESFAEAVIRLHEDPVLWQNVRERGLAQIKDECSEDAFRRAIRDICEEKIFV